MAGDRYWVGNGGAWGISSVEAHFSLSSGGAGGADMSHADNDIHFDENSFTLPGQTVVVGTKTCKSVTFAGVTNIPEFSDFSLTAFGNVTLASPSEMTFSGDPVSYPSITLGVFSPAGSGTLVTAGQTLSNLQVPYGTFGLGDDLTINPNELIISNSAVFSTNNHDINITNASYARYGYFKAANTSTIHLGSSAINVRGFTAAAGCTMDAGTSTINITWTGVAEDPAYNGTTFGGGNKTYNNVNINGPFGDNYVSGIYAASPTFENLSVSDAKEVILQSGFNGTVAGTLSLNGNSGQNMYIHPLNPGDYNAFNKTSGTVNATYLTLEDNTAQGGAIFNALISNGCLDNGGNTGWNFVPPSSGGGGPWDTGFCQQIM